MAAGALLSGDTSSPRQLSFPGWPPAFTPTTFEVLRGDRDMRITVARADRAVALVLDVGVARSPGEQWGPQQFAIELDLRDPPRCLMRGEDTWWNMLRRDDESPTDHSRSLKSWDRRNDYWPRS